jgi:biotin operon repressor
MTENGHIGDSGTGRYRRKRTRRLGDRRKLLDPGLDFDRRVSTESFVPIITRLFYHLQGGAYISGKELASSCRSCWSAGSVWAHLKYLLDQGVLVRTYDGQRTFFALNPSMSAEAKELFRALQEQVEWRGEIRRRIAAEKAARQMRYRSLPPPPRA